MDKSKVETVEIPVEISWKKSKTRGHTIHSIVPVVAGQIVPIKPKDRKDGASWGQLFNGRIVQTFLPEEVGFLRLSVPAGTILMASKLPD